MVRSMHAGLFKLKTCVAMCLPTTMAIHTIMMQWDGRNDDMHVKMMRDNMVVTIRSVWIHGLSHVAMHRCPINPFSPIIYHVITDHRYKDAHGMGKSKLFQM